MSKRWLVVTVRPSSDAEIDALTEGLLALGGSAVQQEHGALISYLPAPANLDEWLGVAREKLGADFTWHWQDDEDWAQSWKRGLRPRRVRTLNAITRRGRSPML